MEGTWLTLPFFISRARQDVFKALLWQACFASAEHLADSPFFSLAAKYLGMSFFS